MPHCHLCPPQCAAAATCAMGRPTRAHWSAGAQCGTLTGWQLTSASFNLKFQGTVTGAVTLMAECSLPVQRGAAAGAPAGQRAATAWVAHTTRHAKMPMPDSETPPHAHGRGWPGCGGLATEPTGARRDLIIRAMHGYLWRVACQCATVGLGPERSHMRRKRTRPSQRHAPIEDATSGRLGGY